MVINKRLRARLYALVGTVVVAVSVQVAALVLSALWEKSDGLSQWTYIYFCCELISTLLHVL